MSSLSVILCTRGRPDRLARVLGDIVAEAVADEIVVVDQSEAHDAARNRRCCERLGAEHVPDAGRGLPRARNVGFGASRGDVLLFLDDDVRLLPGCLRAHLRAFADPTTGGVVGHIVERSLRPNAPTTTNRLDSAGRVRTNLEGYLRVPVATLKGANMSFRRSALEAAGPFDEGYAGTAFLEDADMSTRVARLGWKLWFEPEAAVVHHSEERGGVRTGDAVRTEMWRFRNTGRFVRRHRSVLSVAPMLATFSLVAARDAVRWRRPDVLPRLMMQLGWGWLQGRRGAPVGGWAERAKQRREGELALPDA